MYKKQIFMNCCRALADIETSINILTSIGLLVEPDSKEKNNLPYYLYDACTPVINVAISMLNFPNVNEENIVYDKLLQANASNYEKIAEEAWEQSADTGDI